MFEVARTVKMKDELLKERVLEKFEIEREYWQRRDIDWGIVTEEEIHKVMARNISYIHDYYNIRDYDVFQKNESAAHRGFIFIVDAKIAKRFMQCSYYYK